MNCNSDNVHTNVDMLSIRTCKCCQELQWSVCVYDYLPAVCNQPTHVYSQLIIKVYVMSDGVAHMCMIYTGRSRTVYPYSCSRGGVVVYLDGCRVLFTKPISSISCLINDYYSQVYGTNCYFYILVLLLHLFTVFLKYYTFSQKINLPRV